MQGLVAAGALASAKLRQRGVERVPLLSIAGETILQRVCHCLIEGAGCETVFVLAPEELPLPALPQVKRADYTGDLVADGMGWLRRRVSGDFTVLASSDLPLLTPESVAQVLEVQSARQVDLVYPVCDRRTVEQRFPGTRRTYIRAGRLTVTGGNVFVARREWFTDLEPLFGRLFAGRKNPLLLARFFGLGFLVRALTGLATLDYLETHLGACVHGKVAVPVLPCPDLAVDLDKPADLDLFEPFLD